MEVTANRQHPSINYISGAYNPFFYSIKWLHCFNEVVTCSMQKLIHSIKLTKIMIIVKRISEMRNDEKEKHVPMIGESYFEGII